MIIQGPRIWPWILPHKYEMRDLDFDYSGPTYLALDTFTHFDYSHTMFTISIEQYYNI